MAEPNKNRPNPRPNKSQGGKPKEDSPNRVVSQDPERIEDWLDRQKQKALAGGLLSGPEGENGFGIELINLLRSNPELAARVRDYTKSVPALRQLPGLPHGTDSLKTELLLTFPELYDQYIAATGQAVVRDAEGNPVRIVDPNTLFGMREGDQLSTPELFGADGEVLPAPAIADVGEGSIVGSEAANQFLAARAARQAAQSGGYFSLDELQGGES